MLLIPDRSRCKKFEKLDISIRPSLTRLPNSPRTIGAAKVINAEAELGFSPEASPTFSATWLWFPPNNIERNLEPKPSGVDPTLFEKSPRMLLRTLLSFIGPVTNSKICLKNPVWPALPAKPPKIAADAV